MKKSSLITLLFFLVSCSSAKIKVQAISPAEVDRAAMVRTISFIPFRYDDRLGFGSILEGVISGYSLDSTTPYFKVVARKEISSILQEQKLSSSWMINPEERIRMGKIIGAQSMISGEIIATGADLSTHSETRSKCAAENAQGTCIKFQSYSIACTDTTYVLSVLIKLIDASAGDYIFSNTFTEKESHSKCPDDSGKTIGTNEVFSDLSDKISNNFLKKIAPTKYTLEIKLLEKMDDVNNKEDTQDDLLKAGLEFAKAGRIDKSGDIFKRLGESVNWKSYVANYNYAVMLEAAGMLTEAAKHYKAADELTIKPIEEINEAVKRILIRLAEHTRVVKQLEVKQLEVKQLEVKQLEVKQLEVKQLEVKQLEAKQLEAKQPESRQIATTQPELTQPELTQPELKQPELKQQELKQQELKQPESPQPELKQTEST